MRRAAPLLLLALAGLYVVAGSSVLARRHAPWVRPEGPTADRVIARIAADGRITATYGPTTRTQASILSGPVRLRGTLAEPNGADLRRLFAGLEAFAKPYGPGFWQSIDIRLEIEVEERALTAWLSWLVAMAQQGQVGMTRITLRRMPSGVLIPLDLPQLGEWEGPRPGHKEEPRTRVLLRRGRLPPRDDRQVLKVGRFHHHVGDEVELELQEDGEFHAPPRYRYVADLPSIAAWRSTAARRLLAKRLRRVRALLQEDLTHLDEVPLDILVVPLYTRFADYPAYIVLDVLAGLQGLPNTRLQYDAMVEGWR